MVRFELASRVVPLVLGLALAAAVALTVASRRSAARAAQEESEHRPIQTKSHGYVSSDQCRACHSNEYASWHRSYHRTMTTLASPETIHADFSDTALELDGREYLLRRQGDIFFLEQPAPGTESSGTLRQKVTLVTGSHHMQVYWVETAVGRWLDMLPLTYLREDNRWIPRRMAFLRPPSLPRNPDTGRWNATCVNCHATLGQPRIANNQADTHVAEFGIACEACHGPGAEHVRANSLPWRRYGQHFTQTADATIVQPADLSHEKASEICSHCHGLWQAMDGAAQQRALAEGSTFRPGGSHDEQWLFQPSRKDEDPVIARIMKESPEYADGQFWPDGMARASSREYHGLIDSPCYTDGELSCLSCHTMHKKSDDPRSLSQWADDQLGADMDGDAACTQCHEEIADVAKHSFHPAASDGSRCYNCHMPHTAYGLLKAIRSHQVSSPDVASDAAHGRPNACNLCHLDKSFGWAAAALERNWKIAPPELDDDQRNVPAGALLALEGDAGQRALVAWHMGWAPAREASGESWLVPLLAELVDDPYDAVRIVAERAIRKHGGYEPLAIDPVPPPWQREKLAPRVLARWRELRPPDARGPTPFFTDAGEPDAATFARLLAARDGRPVHLLE